MKYQEILNDNLTASATKLQLGHGWSFQQGMWSKTYVQIHTKPIKWPQNNAFGVTIPSPLT